MIISKTELNDIIKSKCAIPHNYLGMHKCDGGLVVRAYLENAKTCDLVDLSDPIKLTYKMEKLDESGFFELYLDNYSDFFSYRFRVSTYNSEIREFYDAYSFLPTLSEDDLYLIGQANQEKIYEKLGSHIKKVDGVEGVSFGVWAPTARRVSVVGDFNNWDGRYNQMRQLGTSGIWEIFIPSIREGAKYKYEILSANSQTPFLKTDPYAVRFEAPPYNSSIVYDIGNYVWKDEAWTSKKQKTNWRDEAISIYEVHMGSWQRVVEDGSRPLSYLEIAPKLVEYCKEMNFTHVEFMPLSEYPFSGSWGYQVTGFYAPTNRYGTPDEFMAMVDELHQNDIGVIMDWVPAHFPRDSFALAAFDGSCLYEHEDPRQGANLEWGTLVFNYGRSEVSNFLMGSALAWLDRFHIDGLRVDAVASMLYLDYARDEWVANKEGTNLNLEAIDFLKRTNYLVHKNYPGTIMIAEESTAFEGITKRVEDGGLGFDFKWNMGWMHDTLSYMKEDPINRKYHHNRITFPSIYQFHENFMSVYSHDEVVHGKSPMIGKMGGAYWGDKIANLRALYAYMWMWPGKKTLFMGNEFGQTTEWRYDESLEWHLLKYQDHKGIQKVVSDIAGIYKADKLLAKNDMNIEGFEWINADESNHSIVSFLRYDYSGKACYAVICNFTPISRHSQPVGLPWEGDWKEVFNTDALCYGGQGYGNEGSVEATRLDAVDNRPFGACMILPPMSTIVLYKKID